MDRTIALGTFTFITLVTVPALAQTPGSQTSSIPTSKSKIQAQAPIRPGYGTPLTLDDARTIAASAEAAAKAMGAAVAVAIVEPTGDLVLLHKMSDAQYSAPDVAIGKARASARFRRPTQEFEDGLAGGRQALLGMPGAVPIAGGMMILRQGKLIGAVGISGGTSAQDNEVAKAAAAGLK